MKEVMNMEFTFSLCEIFYNMSREQYGTYVDSRRKLDELCKGKKYFDILSHSQEENSLFHNLSHKSYSSAISAIVFQAFAIEAYINFYGAKKLGQSTFNAHYERISIKDKIIIIPRIVTGRDFPKGEKVYELVRKLFTQRDKLVHHKGKGINFKECTEETYQSINHGNLEFVFDDIDGLVNTYPMFIKAIATLEEKTIDLYTEQQTELENEFALALADMMKKAFYGGTE
jgi:hypothetical protein